MIHWLRNKIGKISHSDCSLSPGKVIYAIGDIHGRADLLVRLIEKIEEDIAITCTEPPLIVFLGDYIDRGDDSAEVLTIIERLWLGRSERKYVFLKGNHEASMLDFLDRPEANGKWLRFGGLQTLHSFGLKGLSEHTDGAVLVEVAQRLREKLASQEMFLRVGLRLSLRVGNIFFCHAAVDATRSLKNQPENILLWGDPGFTKGGGPSHAWIVHGHTITPEPDVGRNRIGIDTGAYYSGRLTAARIANDSLRFLST